MGRLGQAVRIAAVGVAALAITISHRASAQTGYCWINAATGQQIANLVPNGSRPGTDDNHRSIPSSSAGSGFDFVRTPDGTWINSATGQPVTNLVPNGSRPGTDDNHRSIPSSSAGPGFDFVRIPCPVTQTARSSGLYIGGELVKNWGWVRSIERNAATDVQTNSFTDHADPVGGGFLIGYRFAPFGNSIVVSPFASFDFMRAPVNHTFANGSFLGTTANFMGTFGVKVGPQFDAFWLYGIGGFAVLNEKLNINFLPVASSQSATVPGGTAGLGGAWRPSLLQGFGLPVSVFAEYQHFWWADANFNRPVASPLFNYTFRRQDDLVKIGFTVDLFPPPPPALPAGPKYVKALPAK